MTEPVATTTNYAGDSAYVGVQAATVHGGVHIYSPPPNASPAEKFQTGIRLLEGGMPSTARQLIREAAMAGHIDNRVCFHWQLALVSGRSQHEMSEEDIAMLRQAPAVCHLTGGDAWADGVKTILRLLDSAQQPEADLRLLLKDLDGLADTQRMMILRHLELFLDGPIRNQIWHRIQEDARQHQMTDARTDRVWKFFEPEPAAPRVRPPQPPDIFLGTWMQALAATTVLAMATIHIGYLLARELHMFALLMYLLSLTGAYCAARGGVEWRFRVERQRTKDQVYGRPRAGTPRAPSGGFARKVDQRFDYYFAKYVPRHTNRSTWLAETAGIRKSIRDEIVEIYREQRIGIERISWLIRYRVSEVKRQWENGTLTHHRQELATPPVTKALTVIGFAVLVLGTARTVESAMQAAPLSAARSTTLALAAGLIAARAWLRIMLERRRYASDAAESARTLKGCEAAFQRWRETLADRPKELEMAAWLDRDRKVLLDQALRHYKLPMSDMIAHAFIEAPASPTKRARVRNGPWRYTRYRLLLFLLTTDGVRQLSAELDFKHGTFHNQNRTNYRHEAVAAVRVHHADDDETTFELALVNGERIQVEAMAGGTEELLVDETPGVVSKVTLDAAGLHHTLHVMEGVAAEGKQWINAQELRRKSDR